MIYIEFHYSSYSCRKIKGITHVCTIDGKEFKSELPNLDPIGTQLKCKKYTEDLEAKIKNDTKRKE